LFAKKAFYKETPMTQGPIPSQVPASAEKPAIPTGTAQPRQGRAARKKAIIELADADLQAASSGGSKPGTGSGAIEQ
jgi:hypothetical protein